MASIDSKFYTSGIPFAAGYTIAAAAPIDLRTIVNNAAEFAAIRQINIPVGLTVFDKKSQSLYIVTDKPSGASTYTVDEENGTITVSGTQEVSGKTINGILNAENCSFTGATNSLETIGYSFLKLATGSNTSIKVADEIADGRIVISTSTEGDTTVYSVATGKTIVAADVDEDSNPKSTYLTVTAAENTISTEAGDVTDTTYTISFDDDALNAKISGIYRIKGSATIDELPDTSDAENLTVKEGDVYNITEAFTIKDGVISSVVTEGDNITPKDEIYPAGTNIVWTEDGWDALAGIYEVPEYGFTSAEGSDGTPLLDESGSVVKDEDGSIQYEDGSVPAVTVRVDGLEETSASVSVSVDYYNALQNLASVELPQEYIEDYDIWHPYALANLTAGYAANMLQYFTVNDENNAVNVYFSTSTSTIEEGGKEYSVSQLIVSTELNSDAVTSAINTSNISYENNEVSYRSDIDDSYFDTLGRVSIFNNLSVSVSVSISDDDTEVSIPVLIQTDAISVDLSMYWTPSQDVEVDTTVHKVKYANVFTSIDIDPSHSDVQFDTKVQLPGLEDSDDVSSTAAYREWKERAYGRIVTELPDAYKDNWETSYELVTDVSLATVTVANEVSVSVTSSEDGTSVSYDYIVTPSVSLSIDAVAINKLAGSDSVSVNGFEVSVGINDEGKMAVSVSAPDVTEQLQNTMKWKLLCANAPAETATANFYTND